MSKLYDVAVIGAGPAGAFFALELARLRPDLSILLIDGQTEERKKPCGGLLAPDAQQVLAMFGLTLPNGILADPQIFTVETIDLVTKQVRYYQRHYLNMDRYRFDRWILSLVTSGVDILNGHVNSIKKDGEIYTLALSGCAMTSKSIVGADGSFSCVRRFLGRRYPYQYVSIQEWYENKGQAMPYYSCIFDRKTSDSCSWTIHKDGYIIFGGAFKRNGCKEAFEAQKCKLEAFAGAPFGRAYKREACLVSSPRRFRDMYCGEARAYLIGEAAGFISASSFEGISSALVSAQKLALAFSRGGEHSKILRSYRKSTLKLRFKLWTKMLKRAMLCSPFFRYLIMKSGLGSLKTERRAQMRTNLDA